jgi:hypothetical protein
MDRYRQTHGADLPVTGRDITVIPAGCHSSEIPSVADELDVEMIGPVTERPNPADFVWGLIIAVVSQQVSLYFVQVKPVGARLCNLRAQPHQRGDRSVRKCRK